MISWRSENSMVLNLKIFAKAVTNLFQAVRKRIRPFGQRKPQKYTAETITND
jgi:hypothetical protein